MFETSPQMQILKHTFRFTESQLTQAHTLIYNSSLVIITNLKPLLSEQLDLRPSSYSSSSTSASKSSSSSLKTLTYIRVTLSSHFIEVAQCHCNTPHNSNYDMEHMEEAGVFEQVTDSWFKKRGEESEGIDEIVMFIVR